MKRKIVATFFFIISSILGGVAQSVSSIQRYQDSYGLFGCNDQKDYSFSFRARNPENAEQVQIWAGFRHANRYDRYVVGLKGGLLDQIYLMRLGYMGTDEFLGERPLRFHPVPGEWYRIKVEVVGQRIRVFIGDEPLPYIDVVDLNGQAASHGEVTLGGGWIETEYDDLVITPLHPNALKNVADTEFCQRKTAWQKEEKRKQERSQYQPITVGPLRQGRTDISLNGKWLFLPEDQLTNTAEAVSVQTDDQDWHVMNVPDFWTPVRIWLHGETMPTPRGPQAKGVSDAYYQRETDRCENYTFDYQKVKSAWYRQWIYLPEGVKDKTMTLHFDAVSKVAEVYVNGTFAGSHVGMFADFEVCATRLLHPGRNLIAVRVMRNNDDDSNSKNNQFDAHYAQAQGNAVRETAETTATTDLLRDMPHGFYGNDPAGIWQPVKLTVTGQTKIEDVFIKPRLDGAAFEVTVRNHGKKSAKLQLYTDIIDRKTGTVLYSGLSLGNMIMNGGEVRLLNYDIADLRPNRWTPQHPHLYDFRFTLKSKNEQDELMVTSGFRTFEVKNGLFYLNGIKYWLRGANQAPSAICPNDEALAHRFFQLMKAGNMEVTRTHTAPFNELWMRAADEDGIAVSFEGTWPWLMLENRPIPEQELLQLWTDEMKALMKKYRNHPSLILWTVNNEMKFYDLDNNKDRAMQKMTVISDVVKQMRTIDPTRPIVYDSNYFRKGKTEKYGKTFMDTIDDGDVDDVHAYYNWYDYSLFRFFNGEFEQWFRTPGRPLISQEMSTGYPNNETGHPTRSYQLIHQNPMSLVGYKGYDFCNPQYFLQAQAFITGELAEALRRTSPNSSGILHFSLHTWFKQTYDAVHIKPWPAYYALSRALQPVLVSAEIWGRNLYGGEKLTTRVFIVNDREDGTDLQPTVFHWQVVDADGQVLNSGNENVRIIRHYEHFHFEPVITMPHVADKQKVRLLLSLTENGVQVSANEYTLTIAPRTALNMTLPKDVRIVEGIDTLSPAAIRQLRTFVRKGGKLLLLNVKEVARQLYPEYIKGWIIPTEGDICFMEKEDDPVFDGIEPMELRYWNDNRRDIPTVCHAAIKTVRSVNVEELVGQMKIHAYIDGGKPLDRIRRIDQMRGYPLIRIKDGKGSVLVSTMSTDKAETDPIAARLLENMIHK